MKERFRARERSNAHDKFLDAILYRRDDSYRRSSADRQAPARVGRAGSNSRCHRARIVSTSEVPTTISLIPSTPSGPPRLALSSPLRRARRLATST